MRYEPGKEFKTPVSKQKYKSQDIVYYIEYRRFQLHKIVSDIEIHYRHLRELGFSSSRNIKIIVANPSA